MIAKYENNEQNNDLIFFILMPLASNNIIQYYFKIENHYCKIITDGVELMFWQMNFQI